MTNIKANHFTLLRTVAAIAALIGTVGSLYFMFSAGRNQKSIFLMALFTAWVISPFAGLFLADKIASRWIVRARASLYWLMIMLAIGSLVAYSGVLTPPHTKAAFTFLVAPLTSWVVIVIVFSIAIRSSTKRPH